MISGLDRVETAIKRLQTFEPPEGYYLAFSGGKDSVVIKALADMAGVKYDAHYNVTTVDPPELVYFIRDHHADVIFDKPEVTMWRLIARKKMPPTKKVRYCCESLKESGGNGRIVVTGVRWAESPNRKNNRAGLEINAYVNRKKKMLTDPDDPGNARLVNTCPTKGKHIVNPIVDWSTPEVWEFIRKYNIPYCGLYNEGFTRLGCVGCPLSGKVVMERDFKRWPKYEAAYLRAFDRMLKSGKEYNWKTGEDVMRWWLKISE